MHGAREGTKCSQVQQAVLRLTALPNFEEGGRGVLDHELAATARLGASGLSYLQTFVLQPSRESFAQPHMCGNMAKKGDEDLLGHAKTPRFHGKRTVSAGDKRAIYREFAR